MAHHRRHRRINQDYSRKLDNASQIATFLLGVILWPIPATGGEAGETLKTVAPTRGVPQTAGVV